MSFGGILASALAGGAGAIGKQASDDIEQGRKTELMKQEADIREQTEKRLTEFRAGVERTSANNKLLDMRNFNASDESIAAAAKIAMGAGNAAQAVQLSAATNEPLNTAFRDKAAADAISAGTTARKLEDEAHTSKVAQTIADSGNLSLLKAMADLENANPTKKAAIDLSKAHQREADAKAGYFARGGAAAGRATGTAGKLDHDLSESARIEYQSLFGEVKAAIAQQSKFEAEGQPLDGNSQPTSQYKLVQNNVAKARRQLSSFQMRNGLLDPEELAGQAIAGETDSAKIGTAIAQAYSQGGSDFGDKFFATVRKSGALERNAEAAVSATTAKRKNNKGDGTPANKSYSSGILTGPRLGYLQNLAKTGRIDAAEQDELDQLLATQGKEWWRGKATGDDSIAQ